MPLCWHAWARHNINTAVMHQRTASQALIACRSSSSRRVQQQQPPTSIDSSFASSTNPHVLMTMASACAWAATHGLLRCCCCCCSAPAAAHVTSTSCTATCEFPACSPSAFPLLRRLPTPHLVLCIGDLKAGAEQVAQQHLAVHRVLGAAQAAAEGSRTWFASRLPSGKGAHCRRRRPAAAA